MIFLDRRFRKLQAKLVTAVVLCAFAGLQFAAAAHHESAHDGEEASHDCVVCQAPAAEAKAPPPAISCVCTRLHVVETPVASCVAVVETDAPAVYDPRAPPVFP